MEPFSSNLLPDDTQPQPSAAYQWAMSPDGGGLDAMYRSIAQFAAGNPDDAARAQAQSQFGVSDQDYQNALAWAAQQNPGQVEAAPTTTPPVGPTGTPAGIATLASAAQQVTAPSAATPYSPSGIATVAPATANPAPVSPPAVAAPTGIATVAPEVMYKAASVEAPPVGAPNPAPVSPPTVTTPQLQASYTALKGTNDDLLIWVAQQVSKGATIDQLSAVSGYKPEELKPVLEKAVGTFGDGNITKEEKDFIDWKMAQSNTTGGGTQADVFARQGIQNIYTDPTLRAQAKEQIERSNRREALGVAQADAAPWTDPNWKTYLGTNKEAYNTAKQVLADPAFAAKFSAQTGLTGANLNAWVTAAISPETRQRQQLAASINGPLVAGPGGNDASRYSEYHAPGEAITSGEKFSKQYTNDELAAVRNGMETYRYDPDSMAKFMTAYGVTKDDAGLILGMSKNEMNKFLGANKDTVPTGKSDSSGLGALANINLGAANAFEALDDKTRKDLTLEWMKTNGVDSKVNGQTSEEYKWTPYVVGGRPASLEQGRALDKSYSDFVANYNKTHDFQPFSLDKASAFNQLDKDAQNKITTEWQKQNGVVLMNKDTSGNPAFTLANGKAVRGEDAVGMQSSYDKMIADYNATHKPTVSPQSGIASIVAANAAAQQNKPVSPTNPSAVSTATPLSEQNKPVSPTNPPAVSGATPLSAQDFSTQYTALQSKKDATPQEWSTFLASALANPQIKTAYGDKLIPAYQSLNTQQYTTSLLTDPYASGTDIQKQIKTLMDDPTSKEKYGDKLQAIYDKAGTPQSGYYGGKQYDSLNPLAVDNIFNQLKAQQTALGTDKIMQGGAINGKDKGFGSVDAVTMDMAKNLAASGITDIKQVGQGMSYAYVPASVQYVTKNGVSVGEKDGKYFTSIPDPSDSEKFIQKEVDPSTVIKQIGAMASQPSGNSSEYGNSMEDVFTPLSEEQLKTVKTDDKGNITFKAETGKGIINLDTGQRLASNYSERTQGPMWSGTFRGPGNTGYGVQFDEKTGTPVFFTRGATSDDLGPLTTLLSFASFIPGVAPFAMAANAALAASQGNWLGALSSGLGAFGGAGGFGNMLGASADTIANLGTLKSGIGLLSAVNNKDWLGALTSGSSLAGMNLGDMKLGDNFSVKDLTSGLSIANALQKGDLAGVLNAAAQMSGSKDAVTAANGLALMKAVQSGNPAAMTSAVAKLQNTLSKPPGNARGGLLHGPAPVKVPRNMNNVDPRMFQGVAANLMARRA